MKLKFLLPAALCLSISNTGYAAISNICCDLTPSSDGSCKCYGIGADCSNCNGGSSGGNCPNCKSTDWAASGTDGYESRIEALCLGIKCNKFTYYRCAKGWYGKAINLTDSLSGCTRCPSSGGVYGTNTAGQNTDITSCCIPANRTMTDTKGTFTFTDECCYSN